MAAVLCLVLLPLMAAVGFMLGAIQGQLSFATVFGGLTFLLLGAGMFVGVFRMVRHWEDEAPH